MSSGETRYVEQHYFTREREGVFRANEGFDTVAKSAGLDAALIKGALHPYCFYKGPRDAAAQPPAALAVYHADSGELVIGQTAYVAADFTGQRSAFFTHQYVIPSARKEAWLREPGRLFGLSGFAQGYDIREGKSLPALDESAPQLQPEPQAEFAETLLRRLGVTRERFEQLLEALMTSVSGRRKVFIVLDGAPAEAERDARRLTRLLFGCLPYAFRRSLGVLTFAAEPEGKQHLHVTFVEKGALRAGDRQLEREMVFDFPGDRFVPAEAGGEARRLLALAWQHREDPEALKPLFDFCDETLVGTDAAEALSPAVYDALLRLYALEQGETSAYAAERLSVWQTIVRYVPADEAGLSRKPRLAELLGRLLRKEAADVSGLAAERLVEALLPLEARLGGTLRQLLQRALALYVIRAVTSAGAAGATPILTVLKGLGGSFRPVFQAVHEQSPRTAETLVAYELEQAGSSSALQEQLLFWLSAGDALPVRFFAGAAVDAVQRLLVRAPQKQRIDMAAGLFAFFDRLPEREGLGKYGDFSELLKLEIQMGLLERIKPTELTLSEVRQLGFMLDKPAPELTPHLTSGMRLTLDLLTAVYRVGTLQRGEEERAAETLRRLGPLEQERALETIRGMWRTELSAASFSGATFGFLRSADDRGSDPSSAAWGAYDYDGLLQFVAERPQGPELVLEFIEWTAQDERFTGPGGGIAPHYRAALSRYFDRKAPQLLRSKPVRQRLLAVPNRAFAALIGEVWRRQAPAWQRALLRKGKPKPLLLTGFTALLVLILLIAFWNPMVGSIVKPVPELQVAELPLVSHGEEITVSAQASERFGGVPDIYVNGERAGQGQASKKLTLKMGENTIVVTALGHYGGTSEPVTRKVMLAPVVGPPLPSSQQP